MKDAKFHRKPRGDDDGEENAAAAAEAGERPPLGPRVCEFQAKGIAIY